MSLLQLVLIYPVNIIDITTLWSRWILSLSVFHYINHEEEEEEDLNRMGVQESKELDSDREKLRDLVMALKTLKEY